MNFILNVRKFIYRFLFHKSEVDETDWRLQNQEQFLTGVKLIKKKYKKHSDNWDHELCAFCWDKFFETPGYLHKSYIIEADKEWGCESCFHDFKERFEWVVVDGSEDGC